MALRVVVGDDSYIVRRGVGEILAGVTDIEIVAACADEPSLLEAIEREEPDVVVTDIRMPPTNSDEGIRVAAGLRASHPQIGVVILSQYPDPPYALRLLEDGSDRRAYLLKERMEDERGLVDAIQAVATGGSVIDPTVVEELISVRSAAHDSPLAELTTRELEVLGALAEGHSNAAIAESLVLTKRAVEKHINSIFLKLGLAHAAEADSISKRVKAALIFLSRHEAGRAADGD